MSGSETEPVAVLFFLNKSSISLKLLLYDMKNYIRGRKGIKSKNQEEAQHNITEILFFIILCYYK